MNDSQRQYAERKKFELSKWTVLWMKILGICVYHKSFSSIIKPWSIQKSKKKTYANVLVLVGVVYANYCRCFALNSSSQHAYGYRLALCSKSNMKQMCDITQSIRPKTKSQKASWIYENDWLSKRRTKKKNTPDIVHCSQESCAAIVWLTCFICVLNCWCSNRQFNILCL